MLSSCLVGKASVFSVEGIASDCSTTMASLLHGCWVHICSEIVS